MQLLGHLQTSPELDPDADLLIALSDDLHAEVAAMNCDNFIVRMHLEQVERFQDRASWDDLSESDRETLQRERLHWKSRCRCSTFMLWSRSLRITFLRATAPPPLAVPALRRRMH